MLLWILRFVRGWVEFRAFGRFPERLLNITSRYGIALWNAVPSKGEITAGMLVSDYLKIRSVARKARVKTRIIKRHGLPFFVARHKPRFGLAVGGVIGFALLLVLSNFVWSIQIVGAENISETKILNVISEKGLEVGSFVPLIDVDKLERDTLMSLDGAGWLSVNLTGSIATVELKEKLEKPEINQPANPSNVKAGCDGVITKINAKNGISVVKPGSGVAKGDLLVSGAVSTKLNKTRYLHANAEVFADVNSVKEIKIDKHFKYYSASENKAERSRVRFLWFELPGTISFSHFENSAGSVTSTACCLNEVTLPLQTLTETSYELNLKNVSLTKSDACKILDNHLLLYEAFERSDSVVKSRRPSVLENKQGFSCRADYVFNENIAENVDFSVTE